MDREKVKLIMRNIELLLDSLKDEIYKDESSDLKQKIQYYEEGGHYDWEQ